MQEKHAMKATDWQIIETAPKDGTRILASQGPGDSYPDIVEWVDWKPGWYNGDITYESDVFTHWMPLPDPPQPVVLA